MTDPTPALPLAEPSGAVPPPMRFNPLGLIALVIVVISYLVAIVIFVYITVEPTSYSEPGTLNVISAVLVMLYVLPFTAIGGLVGAVFGAISLGLRSRRKVLGVLALIFGLLMGSNIWLLAILLTSQNGPQGTPL